jgi:hypothetical protein
MINDPMIYTIGRLEQEERVRSLAPVPDFDPMKVDQPAWVSRQIVRLLHALNGSVSLRRFVKEQRRVSIQPDLRRAKE